MLSFTETKERIYVKGYGFLLLAKKISKNPIVKYRQKLHDSPKKSTANALKMVSNRAIQKLVGKELQRKSQKLLQRLPMWIQSNYLH